VHGPAVFMQIGGKWVEREELLDVEETVEEVSSDQCLRPWELRREA
jgi:hypothetical protein